jgi:predicted SnoaL-like aldol condensation-catalyzing enzyme
MMRQLIAAVFGIGVLAASIAHAQPAPERIVVEAVDAIFGARDASGVDRFLSPDYRQHNPLVADGPAALKTLIQQFAQIPNYRYERFRVIADGDLVMVHGRYTGIRPQPLVAFDIFQVKDGKIVQHWDALQAEAPPNPSGRSMVDGATQIESLSATDANRTLVRNAVETILVRKEYDRVGEFISQDAYAQHNPRFPDGAAALVGGLRQLEAAGQPLNYIKIHRVIAQGNFVLTQSEATLGGAPYNVMDLFRVENGRIVEHWDVLQQVPATSLHTNGVF